MTHLPSRETCVPDWVVEYVNATRFEPHGFLANDLLLKLNFTQASLVAGEQSPRRTRETRARLVLKKSVVFPRGKEFSL